MRLLLAIAICFCTFHGTAVAKDKYKYNFETIETPTDIDRTIDLPDLKPFTIEAMKEKIPTNTTSGVATMRAMMSVAGLWKYTQGKVWKIIQSVHTRSTPKAIIIESGVMNIEDLTKQIDNPDIIAHDSDGIHYDYIIRRPLYVGSKATLVLSGDRDKKLRIALAAENGVFILNRGDTFVLDTHIFSWDEELNKTLRFKDKKIFRPFWVSVANSNTYMGDSIFTDLGYAEVKSYGISLTTDSKASGRPTGWIINNLFDGVFYGFYSYEADDVVILNNEYKDNIYYGIDPHDRSNRLIIAHNKTHGTKKRHGIIISREVNDSFIFNNHSFDNFGTGIMLDRSSRNNIVYNNVSYNNGYYGIALHESEDNLIANNTITGNKKDGIRIRNSWNIKLYDNVVLNNEGLGIDIKTQNVSSFLRIDPFTMRADADIVGGLVSYNRAGGIRFYKMDRLSIADVSMPEYNPNAIKGKISLSDSLILLEKLKHAKGGLIERDK